ncbi:Bug family tripartite tricarboxylate transporter substrate binding protein [Aminivibrio sp.]|jgi:tripartite-type tricarboxylate transporter receptor subunit TctC|uniref:Bug family tripartite tricarboxylate transporter substrate binding protein n=1 Tax=Aminivibrio sp. TaxID=1872489 RepID=UPI003D98CB06
MMTQKKLLLVAAVLLMAFSFGALAEGADFPKAKQIRMVVPYGAGGGVDISTRILATPAQDILGQRIDVVCMPGAGGQEGINFVLQQPKDGYTLLVTDYGPLVTTALTEEVSYDLSDWVPLVQITEVVPTFFVLSESPLKDVAEWVKTAKDKPESLTVAHGRHLSVPHLPLILFEKTAGMKNTHVPTTGGSEALAYVLGKKVDVGASVPSTIASTVKAGTVRPLAVCSLERVATLPDTPTMKELGYDVVLPAWYTVFAPKGVPEETLTVLEEKFIEALNSNTAKEMAAKANVLLTPYGRDKTVGLYEGTISSLKTILADVVKK